MNYLTVVRSNELEEGTATWVDFKLVLSEMTKKQNKFWSTV